MIILHGVDPYSSYTDWNNISYSENHKEKEYQNFLRTIEANAARYTHHRKTSDDAVNDFEDASFDFIFIDGIHTYEQVLKDCQNYYPKLRDGGLFCGHDMTNIAGVGKAVTEFVNSIGKKVSLAKQDVWYFYK
jgi:predicted O-methyltransferase YrrM